MKQTIHGAFVASVFCWSLLSAIAISAADEPVYSGPQPGEPATEFAVKDVVGSRAGQERSIRPGRGDKPQVLVFVHGLERSMVPLMLVVDEYAARHREDLRADFVFLSDDPLASEQRLPLVARSLQLKSPMGLSVDGIEGPGNYGLNRDCLLTLVLSKDGRTVSNFALVQPGIADGDRVIEAMAALVSDSQAPKAEALLAERRGNNRMRGENAGAEARGRTGEAPQRMRSRDGGGGEMNLETEAGLRDAVRRLTEEVRALRRDVDRLKQEAR